MEYIHFAEFDFLIAGEGGGSKLSDARVQMIPVISEEEFESMIL